MGGGVVGRRGQQGRAWILLMGGAGRKNNNPLILTGKYQLTTSCHQARLHHSHTQKHTDVCDSNSTLSDNFSHCTPTLSYPHTHPNTPLNTPILVTYPTSCVCRHAHSSLILYCHSFQHFVSFLPRVSSPHIPLLSVTRFSLLLGYVSLAYRVRRWRWG